MYLVDSQNGTPARHIPQTRQISANIGPAVHRTIVVVDLEGFGDPRRTNAHQVAMRAGLYRALQQSFDRANAPWSDCYREDRGDGILLLAPADIPKGYFVDRLPGALTTRLEQHNRTHLPEEWLRLRLSLHAGEVCYDDHGVTASAITLAFRLLSARSVKATFAGAPAVLAVVASDWFFREVVRNSPAADPATYQRVRISAKETRTLAWVRLY
jgi:hypothetical protein